MKTLMYYAAYAALAVFSLTACSTEDEATTSGNARMKVVLVDAPGPYDEVNVEVLGVEVHTAENGWITLAGTTPAVHNLLDYTNGFDTVIANGNIPAGRISQIRMILGNGNTVMVDSVLYPLTVPSGATSGLKLNVQATLEAGLTYVYTLDFDAARSVNQTGNGEYKLRPVIRVITQALDGGIKGYVMPDTVLTAVYAITGTDTAGTFTDSTGGFFIGGLNTGTYNLYLDGSNGNTNALSGVPVTVGAVTDVDTLQI